MLKVCSTCKILKPIDEFNVSLANADGRQYNCRLCQDKYMKQYRPTHKKKISGYKKKYKEEIENNKYLTREDKRKEKIAKVESINNLKLNKDQIAASIKLFYLNQTKEALR